MSRDPPVLILGAGLTGSLIALALTRLRPEVDFLLVEQTNRFGGGPVLPFFLDSVPLENRWLVEPMIVRKWSGGYVADTGGSTSVPGETAWLVPEQIHAEIVEKVPPGRWRLGTTIARTEPRLAVAEDGRELLGSLILDTRPAAAPATAQAWRHLSSRHLSLARPHDLDRPILIDATFPDRPWAFLQYFPLDPLSLLVQGVAYRADAADGLQASPVGEHQGRILSRLDVAEPISNDPDFGKGAASRLLIRPDDAGLWNPILSSAVASAARTAAAIAGLAQLSRAQVRRRLEWLRLQDGECRSRRLELALTLTGADAGHLLTCLPDLRSPWPPESADAR